MDINNKQSTHKPFIKYNFFLDVKNCPHLLTTLTENISQLGGVSSLEMHFCPEFICWFADNRVILKQECQVRYN